jgi:predicted lipoprotein
MAHLGIRSGVRSLAVGVLAISLGAATMSAATVPARADVVAYLVNMHVRPGYDFPNADAALRYGHAICEKTSAGRGYPQLIDEVKADFDTPDEFHASYLISQAVNELCPALIWQLRNSAAGYPAPPETG